MQPPARPPPLQHAPPALTRQWRPAARHRRPCKSPRWTLGTGRPWLHRQWAACQLAAACSKRRHQAAAAAASPTQPLKAAAAAAARGAAKMPSLSGRERSRTVDGGAANGRLGVSKLLALSLARSRQRLHGGKRMVHLDCMAAHSTAAESWLPRVSAVCSCARKHSAGGHGAASSRRLSAVPRSAASRRRPHLEGDGGDLRADAIARQHRDLVGGGADLLQRRAAAMGQRVSAAAGGGGGGRRRRAAPPRPHPTPAALCKSGTIGGQRSPQRGRAPRSWPPRTCSRPRRAAGRAAAGRMHRADRVACMVSWKEADPTARCRSCMHPHRRCPCTRCGRHCCRAAISTLLG